MFLNRLYCTKIFRGVLQWQKSPDPFINQLHEKERKLCGVLGGSQDDIEAELRARGVQLKKHLLEPLAGLSQRGRLIHKVHTCNLLRRSGTRTGARPVPTIHETGQTDSAGIGGQDRRKGSPQPPRGRPQGCAPTIYWRGEPIPYMLGHGIRYLGSQGEIGGEGSIWRHRN
jgi:hypothetical protein